MNTKGYTLIELLVGLVISLMLISAMTMFMGNASYSFQTNKSVVQDRGELRRSLAMLTRDLMEIGVNADEDGIIAIDTFSEYFVEFDNSGPGGSAVLSYWRCVNDMDALSSQDPSAAATLAKMYLEVVIV